MAYYTYTVEDVIDYSERLYITGGVVERWFSRISRELEAAIKAEAPVNVRPNKNPGAPPRGTLRLGISVDDPQLVGPRDLQIDARSSTDYTRYVVRGTSDIIVRDAGGRFGRARMLLPEQPGLPSRRVQKVRGQRPNDFFMRGYDRVAAIHEGLG